jgi:hypothetical protein
VALSVQDILSSHRLLAIVSVTVKKTVILSGGVYGTSAWSLMSSEEQTGHVYWKVAGS